MALTVLSVPYSLDSGPKTLASRKGSRTTSNSRRLTDASPNYCVWGEKVWGLESGVRVLGVGVLGLGLGTQG